VGLHGAAFRSVSSSIAIRRLQGPFGPPPAAQPQWIARSKSIQARDHERCRACGHESTLRRGGLQQGSALRKVFESVQWRCKACYLLIESNDFNGEIFISSSFWLFKLNERNFMIIMRFSKGHPYVILIMVIF
jgi:hypothetical protein